MTYADLKAAIKAIGDSEGIKIPALNSKKEKLQEWLDTYNASLQADVSETVQPVEPIETVQPVEPIETVQPIETVETIETVQPVEPLQTAQDIEINHGEFGVWVIVVFIILAKYFYSASLGLYRWASPRIKKYSLAGLEYSKQKAIASTQSALTTIEVAIYEAIHP